MPDQLDRRRAIPLPWLLEMIAWSLVLPILRRRVPIERLARLMAAAGAPRNSAALEHSVVRWSNVVARRRPRATTNCLERSLIAFRFLGRAGASPTLVLGVASGESGVTGHAWVEVDDEPVGDDAASVDGFAPLLIFGVDGVPVAGNATPLPEVWQG